MPRPLRASFLAATLLLGATSVTGCRVPEREAADADRQVYGILERATEQVTGQAKVVPVDRPSDTLRRRLEQAAGAGEPLPLRLVPSLDAAAENSRDFQRQKESLYQVALGLTRTIHDFSWRFGAGAGANVAGVGDDSANLSLSDDLRASQNTLAGPRIVASFANTFLRSLINGGGFDSSSILGFTLSQPLLRGMSPRVIREPLTQAERDVIYQVRDFERFRSTFAVRVVSDYYRLLELTQNLDAEVANRDSLTRARQRIEAMAEAGRNTATDVGRARQNELSAENRLVDARTRLESAVDRFLITLGLPTDARAEVDLAELRQLAAMPIAEVDVTEAAAVELAFARRLDYRNTRDEVEDAVRRVLVAEDAFRSQLDFSAAINVPTDDNQSLDFDWSRVSWRAGFDLELAIDKLPERNAYRSALINLDVFIRAREQFEDEIKRDVRDALRTVQRSVQSYQIQSNALGLAEQRVESTRDFFAAGDRNVTILDVLDAQESLLSAQLSQMSARVAYAIARLQLMLTLDALQLEPMGLRYDQSLPMPKVAAAASRSPSSPVTRP